MNTMQVNGKDIKVDGDGYLLDYKDWDKNVAIALAAGEKLEMTEGHWEVVNLLREYYSEHQTVPTLRDFLTLMGETYGKEKNSKKYLSGLFPIEPAKISGKVAGLPKLTGCM